jgi:hypothetical protein
MGDRSNDEKRRAPSRPVNAAQPASPRFRGARELTEVYVHREGHVPIRAMAPSAEAPSLMQRLRRELRELPRLAVSPHHGAVDLQLRDAAGAPVKSGTVVLNGPGGSVAIAIDPNSRRFRLGELAPGSYMVRAASASAGQGTLAIAVRAGDVTRQAVPLDGRPSAAKVNVELAVKGTQASQVQVRAVDRNTGKVAFDGLVDVVNGVLKIAQLPIGVYHFDIRDDAGAQSCYDTDVTTILAHVPLIAIQLDQHLPPPPGLDDTRFAGLPPELGQLTARLPEFGVHSIEQLAAVESEALVHLVKQSQGGATLPQRWFSAAVDAARAQVGLTRIEGEHRNPVWLGKGGRFERAFLPRAAGDAQLAVRLPAGQQAELMITRPSGAVERHVIHGSQVMALSISAAEAAGSVAIQVSLSNSSSHPIRGDLVALLPGYSAASAFAALPTTHDRLEYLYRALAVQNPGIGTTVVPKSLEPENIQSWLDRARAFLTAVGVCSLDDLGKLRLDPARLFHVGAYLAPLVPPTDPSHIVSLTNYSFSEILDGKVVYYRPNDLLHSTAVVLAGEWDITGQSVIIAQEVRELVVIARSIRWDSASRITWEMPPLPATLSYWPNPAPRGPDGPSDGVSGANGTDGDQDPAPSLNGGGNAVTPAPILTLYIFDATNNLPPIDLHGQDGGAGGPGQDGGDGGNGAQGWHADSHFLSCCREVGWGGNGGNGGRGGRGGPGGNGGQGGRITLLTSDASIGVLSDRPPSIDITSGHGGDGGPAGNPGSGGHAGPAGSADCETFCDDHDERVGSDGVGGGPGSTGNAGVEGPAILSDALQVLPISLDQWNAALNMPHILQATPTEVEPGETVTIIGLNFQVGSDKIFFDGGLQPDATATISSSTDGIFTVPLDSQGGTHPIVIRPVGVTSRRSNRVMIRVIPKVDAISTGTRWNESTIQTVTGLAFATGCHVIAEDWDPMIAGHPGYNLPVTSNTRTSITLSIPAAPLNNLRGVRRIRVRNPDGGVSRGGQPVRISDTIVINCAAWRVIGTTDGVGTARSAADIASLFNDSSPYGISRIWAQGRVSFRLLQPVGTIHISDDHANIFPYGNRQSEKDLLTSGPGVAGAFNYFFVRALSSSTAYAYYGGGPLIIGDNGGDLDMDALHRIVAHESGHAMCLHHVCNVGADPTGTFFGRDCGQEGDTSFLMYPYWNTQTDVIVPPAQIVAARSGATHLEEGKVNVLPVSALFSASTTCGGDDTE